MIVEATLHKTRRFSFPRQLPLEPIRDDHSYRQAIEILDRLFVLPREKTREEMAYFQSLAQWAYEYECVNA